MNNRELIEAFRDGARWGSNAGGRLSISWDSLYSGEDYWSAVQIAVRTASGTPKFHIADYHDSNSKYYSRITRRHIGLANKILGEKGANNEE